jgi:chitinase domain-containing protein 1
MKVSFKLFLVLIIAIVALGRKIKKILDAETAFDDDSKLDLNAAGLLQAMDTYEHKDAKECEGKRFGGEVLAYVTPWNGKGYDEAVRVASRLDWVSPVWLQIRGYQTESPDSDSDASTTIYHKIEGIHDIDESWMADVRAAGTDGRKTVNIVPRVVLETPLECQTAGRDDSCRELSIELAELKEKNGFDGYTLEIPLQHWKTGAVLAALLKHLGCKIIYVLPPIETSGEEGYQNYADFFNVFEESVDRFNVMTYDANQGKGKPNAPLPWVKNIINGLGNIKYGKSGPSVFLKEKLLLGIPLYGWRSDGEAMTASSMKEWMSSTTTKVDITWDYDSAEHIFVDNGGMTASYPTIPFMCSRLEYAGEYGNVGIGLWELGQGMPFLLDAL